MATEIIYDSTGQTVEGQDNAPSNGGAGFSFSSDANSNGTISDVKLNLSDATPNDGGAVSVGLYTSANGAPGTLIANLGAISDANLSTSQTLVDLPVSANVPLTANTQYFIETNASANSQVFYAYGSGDTGTGVSGQSFEDDGAVQPNSTGAYVAQVSEAVCFASGTLIRTANGDVPVENLRVGDIVVTGSNEHRPIRWLGHRTIHCRSHLHPEAVMPVRIRAHAFAPGRPSRDLRVSPGHALCIDVLGEVLIPARVLVNGTTIVQENVDHITYWHVELEIHSILLAENMPAESYIDLGNRGFFVETAIADLCALPDAATHTEFCRPFYAEGAVVAAARAQITARARRLGWPLRTRGQDPLDSGQNPVSTRQPAADHSGAHGKTPSERERAFERLAS